MKGVTVIEILVALSILAIGAVALSAWQLSALQLSRRSNELLQVLRVAETELSGRELGTSSGSACSFVDPAEHAGVHCSVTEHACSLQGLEITCDTPGGTWPRRVTVRAVHSRTGGASVELTTLLARFALP